MRTRHQSIGIKKREHDEEDYEPTNVSEESMSNASDESRADVKKKEKKMEKKLPKERKKRSRIEKVAGRSHRLSAFQSRCSLAGLQKVCGRLSEAQIQIVKDMGFGGVLDVKCNALDRVLCLELVDSFDLQTNIMWCRGQKIPVTAEEVVNVFDLPWSGISELVIRETTNLVGSFSIGILSSGLFQFITIFIGGSAPLASLTSFILTSSLSSKLAAFMPSSTSGASSSSKTPANFYVY